MTCSKKSWTVTVTPPLVREIINLHAVADFFRGFDDLIKTVGKILDVFAVVRCDECQAKLFGHFGAEFLGNRPAFMNGLERFLARLVVCRFNVKLEMGGGLLGLFRQGADQAEEFVFPGEQFRNGCFYHYDLAC